MADSPARVLIIDDNKDLLHLHRDVLESEGYEVHTALGGRPGLEAILSIVPLDLVLLDIKMDDLSGLELLRIVAEKHPEIHKRTPIILLSAMDPPEEPHGAAGYIRKTWGIKRLLATIKEHLRLKAAGER